MAGYIEWSSTDHVSNSQDVFFAKIAPVLGCLVSTLTFISPLSRVLQARRENSLAGLNSLPMPLILANCAGWVAFGYVQGDIYIYLANEPGLLLGIFFTMSVYGLSDQQTKNQLLGVVLFFAALLTALGGYCAFKPATHKEAVQIWGYTTNIILLLFYASPLSAMASVVRTRSSAALVWQLSVMSVANGSLWVLYGLHKSLPFVWVPNAAGACLGALQLLLICIFPQQPSERKTDAREPLLEAGEVEPEDVERGVAV